jgi:hypothetical protein
MMGARSSRPFWGNRRLAGHQTKGHAKELKRHAALAATDVNFSEILL